MFKNAILYHVNRSDPLPEQADLDAVLQGLAFQPTAPTQAVSVGFVPPRGHEHGALHERVGFELILRVRTETRQVPAATLQRLVDEKAKAFEEMTGRKPGKKHRRELKEEALLELLPRAFPKRSDTTVWISPQSNLVVVDATSVSRAEAVATLLVRAIDGMHLSLLQTQTAPAVAMAKWLSDREGPAGFSIDRECVLKSTDEMKSVVRYSRHPLDLDQVVEHIQLGKQPTSLAMTWEGRVSFVLTDALAMKRITLDDGLMSASVRGLDHEGFDADAAIFTCELKRLLGHLEIALDLRIHPST